MADKKISQLTSATTPLAGTEVLPIVQSSTTKKVSVAEMQSAPVTAGTANGVQYLDATKSPTTGSTLVFVNDNLGVNTDTPRLNTSGVTAGNKTITIYSATSGGGGIEFATGSTTTSAATGRACFIAAGNTDGSRTIAAIDSLIQGSTAGNQGGNMRLFTKPDGGSAAVRLTLAAAGDVTVNTGNLVIGTAGKGIDFSADGQAAGMTSELLDDYEEGTWTPVFASAAGTITSTTVNGATYTKVGRLVTLGFDVTITDNGTGSVAINVTGLPFALAAAYSSAGSLIEVAAVGFGGFVNPNSTTSLSLTKYDWTYPGGTNYRLVGSISYNV